MNQIYYYLAIWFIVGAAGAFLFWIEMVLDSKHYSGSFFTSVKTVSKGVARAPLAFILMVGSGVGIFILAIWALLNRIRN